MTVFVFSTSDHVLRVFDSAAAALGRPPSEEQLYFAADGSALRRETGGGANYLRPWASCSAPSLSQVLHMVQTVEGRAPLDSVPAIEAALQQHPR